MLRITPSENAAQAKSYYTEGLSREDYYSQGQEIAGCWGGIASRMLGLEGEVSKQAFDALADNRHPKTGERLTPKTVDNRRVGYDFNFHAPKSLSVLYAFTDDSDIVRVFREAADATMREIEAEMKTRVRIGGQSRDRVTGNLAWAEFVHLTARPVEGHPDPHLHVHAYAFNATWDESEKRWKAGQFGDLKADAPYFEAAFHARLAKAVRELGYPVQRRGKGWEIAGVPVSAIDKFSRRTAEIERHAERKGITSAKAKDMLGAATRENKRKGIGCENLRGEWDARLDDSERAAIRALHDMKSGGACFAPALDEPRAVDHALGHAFERRSAVPQRKLAELALRRGVGSVEVGEVHRELEARVARRELLRRDRAGIATCTTADVLKEERALLKSVREGRGTCRPLGRAEPPPHLGQDQREAMAHLLASSDRIMALRGRAGTGKTTLMKEVAAAIRSRGKEFHAFAPTAEAARGLLREEGFAGAETVAKLLGDPRMQESIRGQVIWVDEAGLLGTPTMRRLAGLTEAKNARLILTGDPGQHAGVERGDAFRVLLGSGALPCPDIRSIRRQRAGLREAVASFSDGKVLDGFRQLESLGAVREIVSAHDRSASLADAYCRFRESGASVLAVAPTHREARAITLAIRDGLRARGRLGQADARGAGAIGKEAALPVLRKMPWTEAEKQDPALYREGLVVQFHRPLKGVAAAGDRLDVCGCGQDHLVLARGDSRHRVPLSAAARFHAYEREQLPILPGESLRITQNGTTKDGRHRLHNGTVQALKGLTPEGNLLLENGWVVDRGFAHLDHGYVVTSHASQGKTVDHVLVAESTESLAAASKEQFYVSVSRARHSATIFTDDAAALKKAVVRSSERLSAVELVGEKEAAPSYRSTVGEVLWLQHMAAHARRIAAIPAKAAERGRAAVEAIRNALQPNVKRNQPQVDVPSSAPKTRAQEVFERYGRPHVDQDRNRSRSIGRDRER